MGLFDALKGADINQGIETFRNTPGAVLLDVRSPQEYADGRIPGSKNIPLPELPKNLASLPDKDAPIFTYCLSGGRSQRAAAFLEKAGYVNVTNIGGINSYHGEVEK